MGEVVEVTSADHLADLVEQNDKVVVDFWASWCGPCRSLKPHFAAAAEKVEGAVLATLDVEALPKIAEQFRVLGVPTVLVFKGGELKDRPINARNAMGLIQEIESA